MNTSVLGSRRIVALRTLLAGIAGVLGSYTAVGSAPSFVAAPIESWLAATVPDAVLRVAITVVTPIGESFGISHLGQAINLGTALLLAVILIAVLALAALAIGRVRDDTATTGALALALPVIAVLALTGSVISALGTGLGCALVVVLGELAHPDTVPTGVDPGRRDLLGSLAGTVVVALGGTLLGGRSASSRNADAPQPLSDANSSNNDTTGNTTEGEGGNTESEIDRMLAAANERSLGVSGLEALVSGADFYEVDINSIDPEVGSKNWSLSVTGAVAKPIELGYDDLTAESADHRFLTLRCVSDPLNGSQMDTALWTGVPVKKLLERANAQGKYLKITAADDYFQGFRLDELDDAMIAYGMDRTTLPRSHGAPVRLLVPGHWGEIQVKWITGMEVLKKPIEGFWEQRGWHGVGTAHTVAKLRTTNRVGGNRIQVGGHAYAGTRGVSAVQVSIDGGEWRETELSKPLPASADERARGLKYAGAAWRQWTHTYDSPGTEHTVRVRAIEADGTIQPRESMEPYPRGATGWVSKTVSP